jgi:DNA-binding Lrp family transcriptional regulator
MIPVGFMFLECAQGSQDEILQKAREIPGVAYAYKVDKNYDLVIKIESDSVEKFTSAISQIRVLGNLVNTDTMVGFKG